MNIIKYIVFADSDFTQQICPTWWWLRHDRLIVTGCSKRGVRGLAPGGDVQAAGGVPRARVRAGARRALRRARAHAHLARPPRAAHVRGLRRQLCLRHHEGAQRERQ